VKCDNTVAVIDRAPDIVYTQESNCNPRGQRDDWMWTEPLDICQCSDIQNQHFYYWPPQ